MSQIGDPVRLIEGSEPIVGFRSWYVRGTGQLRSLAYSTVWEPGETMTAKCRLLCGACPHKACRCGIYAFRELDSISPRRAGTYVTGAVELSGRIVEHELGFRAQHARPVALCESFYAHRIADVYGLPVVSREDLAMEAAFLTPARYHSSCGM